MIRYLKKILLIVILTHQASACGIPKKEHNAVLQNLEDTRIELSKAQVQTAEQEKSIHMLSAASLKAKDRILKLENLQKQLQGDLAQSKESLRIFESKTGTLEQRLAATKSELVELRKARAAAEKRAKQYRELTQKLSNMVRSGKLSVKIRSGKMVIQLDNAILFAPGKTTLKKDGNDALVEVAKILKDIKDRQFLIAGHTDNIPVKNKRHSSNWELSTARAVEVLAVLEDNGVDPKALAAAGYGEFDPVAPNDKPEQRALNRRIEIILMPNLDELPTLSPDLSGS